MRTPALLIAALLAGPAASQLVPAVPRVGDAVTPIVRQATELPRQAVSRLDAVRIDRILRLVRANPGAIALDPRGFPARAHEVIVLDPTDVLVRAAAAKGFSLIETSYILDVCFARLRAPDALSLKAAIATLRRLGARDPDADQLFFPGGVIAGGGRATPPPGPVNAGPIIGIIDGGVAGPVAAQRGFAKGAPRPSDHGTAIASLILGGGGVRGAAPGARLLVADIYGTDPAGGSATAIAKAFGWLAGQGAPIISISLVGPANPIMARVVAAAQAKGIVIVAAVGNDGPAAPHAYPASYPSVIAVTGVDRRDRVLIEAGSATHLDYAAPAADMLAANASGASVPVRGTSFAAPLVAARLARAYPQATLAAALAAVDAEAKRRDKRYGRGLVCAECRTPAR